MSVAYLTWLACAAAATCLVACAGGQRDVVPETQDVTVHQTGMNTNANDAAADPAAYAHLAKRRHGVVALAEARGFQPGEAEKAIDHLADSFETCAAEREREGKLVKGAARVVVRVDDGGNVDGLTVRAAPGPAVATNLLLCIIAPLKAASYGTPAKPSTATANERGFAIETEWSPLVAAAPAAAPAASSVP